MHVLVNGNDLWREQVTRFATYARNLAIATQALGAKTNLLVNTTGSLAHNDPLLTEIEFYDSRSPKWFIRAGDTSRRLRRGVRSVLTFTKPTRAYDIPIPGRVVSASFVGRLRHLDSACAATDIFSLARQYFHLTVLEMMTLGTPVISSNADAPKERDEDAVAYVDPYRVDEIRAAVERIAKDEAFIEELKRKGLQKAVRFSADTYARRLGDLYGWLIPGRMS
jgi:glycosyltransferase involved in cell wall biosynthesis